MARYNNQRKYGKRGVRSGYSHDWWYRHRKEIDDGKRFTYYQTKGRKIPAKGMGSFTKGSEIFWGLKGKYKVIKVKGGYKVVMTGKKRALRVKIKRRRN